MSHQSETGHTVDLPKSARIEPDKGGLNRTAFWSYCRRAAANAIARIDAAITADDIDRLLVDQQWRCAVSGIELQSPTSGAPRPFGPSLDRIIPGDGYVPGNIRVVCNIVNFAMNQWGETALRKLVAEMGGRSDAV